MKKNLTFNLSILSLLIASILAVPSVKILTKSSCAKSGPDKLPVSMNVTLPVPGSVTASIATDRLSTVSGTKQQLNISITNNGEALLKDGSVVVSIFRQTKDTEVLIMRSIVEKNVVLKSKASESYVFNWSIPATLPTGLYQIDATFFQGGNPVRNGTPITNNPFGNSTRIFVKGDATNDNFLAANNLVKFIEPLPRNNSVGFVYSSSTSAQPCKATSVLYSWLVLIGGLGVVMVGLVYLRDGMHNYSK